MKSYFTTLRLRTLIIGVLILVMPVKSYAQNEILIVLSDKSNIYNELYVKLNTKSSTINNFRISYADDITEELLNNHKLIIVAGTKSATIVNNYKFNTPLLYSLVPKDFYNQSINNHSCPGSACYGIYIEQPIARYMQLTKVLFGNKVTITIPISRSSHYKYQQIKSIAQNVGLKAKKITVSKNTNIPRLLSSTLKEGHVLLALPDPDIYNKNTARSILLSTYHSNIPLIGYSQAFAKAGAIASLYSSIDDIASQTVFFANRILSDNKPQQKGYYPDNFSLEINKAVARSLNINIISPETIKRRIK